MSAVIGRSARQYLVAVRALLGLVALAVVYTTVLTVVGQVAMPDRANGSLITQDGRVIGSSLLGQRFTGADGTAANRWFQSRPSAAGNGYDASSSGASNLGPENPALVDAIEHRRAAVAKELGVAPSRVPADAITASGSGLDPDISPASARLQAGAVARARGIPSAAVARLVERAVRPPDLGFLGAPAVNVLELNVALARMDPEGNG